MDHRPGVVQKAGGAGSSEHRGEKVHAGPEVTWVEGIILPRHKHRGKQQTVGWK